MSGAGDHVDWLLYDGPVIDPHVHLKLDEQMAVTDRPHLPHAYLSRMRDVDLRAAGVLVIAPPGDLDRTRQMNDLVLDLAQEEPWYAMCSIHPADGDLGLAEIERVADAGARGLKLHPNAQDFDVADDAVARVVEHASTYQLPVLFDAYSPFDPAQPGKFVKLAMSRPEARLVLAHMHGPNFPELLTYEVLSRYPWWKRNVWFDMSATANLFADSPYCDQLAWVCRKLGTDRLLWASDFPLDDPCEALRSLAAYGFSREELSAICHENASALFGVDNR